MIKSNSSKLHNKKNIIISTIIVTLIITIGIAQLTKRTVLFESSDSLGGTCIVTRFYNPLYWVLDLCEDRLFDI